MLDAAQALKAEQEALKRGQVHLAGLFREMRLSSSASKPKKHDGKPKLCFIFNNHNWCDGRLSKEIANNLSDIYDCRLVDSSDNGFYRHSDDAYLFRNVGRLNIHQAPSWAKSRSICMIESERPLEQARLIRLYSKVTVAVAQNKVIRDMARASGISNVANFTIGNGVNCEEFYPADEYPEEFTVGASGNFSTQPFDNWKGFGKYIVPACKMAGVKLRWCSWKGQAWSQPGVKGEQVPIDKMADWYRSISCLVSMSKSESCSGVVFEAMASGVPVISTKTGWHHENCSDEILWVDRPAEHSRSKQKIALEELAHKLWWLKKNPAAARALGMRGRKFAEKWPHSRIASQWDKVISAVLSRNPQTT